MIVRMSMAHVQVGRRAKASSASIGKGASPLRSGAAPSSASAEHTAFHARPPRGLLMNNLPGVRGSNRREAMARLLAFHQPSEPTVATLDVAHPDGRPYPWLSCSASVSSAAAAGERYLVYQPFAGMCNQFSCLECAVALARVTGRTLVLPRWRPQYGWPWLGETPEYFDTAPLSKLVRCITLDELAKVRENCRTGEGVALLRLFLEYNPTWSDRGFELYPALRSLLEGLEYFAEIDADGQRLHLGCGGGDTEAGVPVVSAEVDRRISLGRPLRGEREVASYFADVPQPVLALDHAFNILVCRTNERGDSHAINSLLCHASPLPP